MIYYWYPNVPLPTPSHAVDELDRLARFIIEVIPGEPSRSEGVVDTAIRLLMEAK